MKTKTLKPENMLRITEVDLLNKLQEKFELSTCKSANSFFNRFIHRKLALVEFWTHEKMKFLTN